MEKRCVCPLTDTQRPSLLKSICYCISGPILVTDTANKKKIHDIMNKLNKYNVLPRPSLMSSTELICMPQITLKYA